MNGSTIGGFPGIKRSAIALATAMLFFCSANAPAQDGKPLPPTPISPQSVKNGVEILSDTQGVDFGPYVRKALTIIKKNWLALIPEEARPPANMQGETLIRFSILPDGKISAMKLDGSSQHINIDRAAWGAITGVGQFPPLPTEFKGSHLELRIDFLTNRPLPGSANAPPQVP